jgi:membrane-bound lytic murein transglycosylase D
MLNVPAEKGVWMKVILSLFFFVLLTPLARADNNQAMLPSDAVRTAVASASPAYLPGAAYNGRTSSRAARLKEESDLGKALELPPSDIFVQDESIESLNEYELKLPEEDLPQSDIPLTVNHQVEYFINYFQGPARNSFAKWLSRSERYIPMMKQVLKEVGLPEDLVYLAMIESGFSPHAYSVAAAVGPWQFISGTGKRYSLRIDSWIDERRDPLKSTIAAALYLKELYSLFNKDWYLAAAGYNAGENKILRAIDMYSSRDFWELSQGSYLKRETKDYVPKLLAAAIVAKDPARYGFADVAYLPPIEFDMVEIPSKTDLDVIARLVGVSTETIRDLNPALRRGSTPPDYPNYVLKIPKGKKQLFQLEYANLPREERQVEKLVYARYKAGKKDTLATIARRFGTKPEVIAELNHLKKGSRLGGKVLNVPTREEVAAASPGPVRKHNKVAESSKKPFVKYYTVKHGDTVHSVAKRFNVSTRIIVAWNNLKGKLALNPGKRIIVAKFMEKGGALVPLGENS